MASSLANLAKKKSDPPPPPPPQKIEVKVEEVSQDQETNVLISPTLKEALELEESSSDVGLTSAQEASAESGDSSAASLQEEQVPKKKEKAKSPPKKKDRRSKT